MYDAHKPHPLLAQIPLTVSPFLSIPTAVTLPYTFRSVPALLPVSVVTEIGNGGKAKFVKSTSGHAAHPDDIIAACNTLSKHLDQTIEADRKLVEEWEIQVKDRDLAEKRRVAPGWLDREEKILEPTKARSQQTPVGDLLAGQSIDVSAPVMSPSREGEELDRVFGKLGIK